MKKTIIPIIIALLIFSGCTKSNNNVQEITLALDYTPNTNHTGIYVAQKLKYYQNQGLKVKVIQTNGTSAEQLVNSKKADFGISYEENILQANNDNMKLKAIYAIQAHNTSGFISNKNKNIKQPKDFNNKTYCGWGSNVETSLVKTLNKNDGGNPNTIKFLTTDSNFFTANKQCDFFWVYNGWDVVNADIKQKEYNYFNITDYGIDWYTPVIITNEDNIKNNKKTINKFIKATKKGYQYAIDNPQKSSQILLEQNPELDKDLIQKSQEKLSTYYKGEKELGEFDSTIYEKFGQFLKDNKIIDTNLNIKETYTNEFI